MEEIPLIQWPEESGLYKVAQFQKLEVPYLRFGFSPESKVGDFHKFMVREFAQEAGIQYREIKRGDIEIFVFPEDSPFKLIGAGWCELKLEEKIALFKGRSEGYNLQIDTTHINNIAGHFPQWSFRY